MVLIGAGIAQDHGLAIDVFDDHINLAVVIEIAESCSPAGFGEQDGRTGLLTNILERAFSVIPQHNFSFPVLATSTERIDLRVHMPVDNENVGPPVIIKILTTDSPLQELDGGRSNP